MIYVPMALEANARAIVNFDGCAHIHRSGSVMGMRNIYGWPKGGQIRLGQWIYNLGPIAVQRLRDARLVKG